MWNKIALKYCGGCNPQYNRREATNELKEKLGNRVEWVTVDSGEAEAVIVVQGCPRACADLSELPDVPMFMLTSVEQIQTVVADLIQAYNQPGDDQE